MALHMNSTKHLILPNININPSQTSKKNEEETLLKAFLRPELL
jgi:hypothetical protein